MDTPPTVSVVISTYNRADLLDQTLASVFAQTYRDFEVIVVDDGSTDHTRRTVQKYGDRINFIHQRNSGRSLARNAGIAAARGEYIAFLDDDDLWLPRKVELQVRIFEASPDVDVVYSPMRVIGGSAHGAVWNEAAPAREHLIEQLLSRNCVGNPSVVMVRRASLEAVGLFDPYVEPCEDWDFWIRLAIRGCNFQFIPEPLIEYRVHESNTSLQRLHSGFLAVLNKVFASEGTPASLKRRRCFYLSRRWVYIGNERYFLLQLGEARRAWLEAVRLDSSVLSPRMVLLLAKSLCGAHIISSMRRAKAALLREARVVTGL